MSRVQLKRKNCLTLSHCRLATPVNVSNVKVKS